MVGSEGIIFSTEEKKEERKGPNSITQNSFFSSLILDGNMDPNMSLILDADMNVNIDIKWWHGP